jgi:hypothetical protein
MRIFAAIFQHQAGGGAVGRGAAQRAARHLAPLLQQYGGGWVRSK